MIPTLLGFILVGPMIKKLGVVKTLLVSFAMGAGANYTASLHKRHLYLLRIVRKYYNICNHSDDVSGWSYDGNVN